MENKWSYSRIVQYQICPLSYKYVWIEKRVPSVLSSAIELGLAVHESISNILKGESTYEKEISRLKEFGIKAARCLQNWYRGWLRRDEVFVGTEIPLSTTYEGYEFTGRVDGIFRKQNGIVVIEDFKTGHRRIPREELQMMIYYILTQENSSRRQFRWSYLNSDEYSIRNDQEIGKLLESNWSKIRQLIETIEADTEFKPRISSLCSQCSFFRTCEVITMRKPTRDEVRAASLPPWKTIDVGETVRLQLSSDLYWIEEGEEDLMGRICPWAQYQIRARNLSKGGKEQVLLGPGNLYAALVEAIEKAGANWNDPDFFKDRVVVISRPDKNTFIVECESKEKARKK